jgi:chromosomal replication initiator protein
MSKRLVQDVAAARHSGGVTPARANISQPPGSQGSGDRCRLIWDALRDRIGAERHAVWFGDVPQIEMATSAGGGTVAMLTTGDRRTQEWLRKMFKADVEAAVRQVCGSDAAVEWQMAPADDAGPAPQPATASLPQASASRPANARRPATRPAPAPSTPRPASGHAVPVRPTPRLEAFVVGPANRMAHAAIELAASRPGEMSPLVLHGPTGTGKTHLLEGICHHFRTLHPRASAVYLSGEQFTTTFLQSLHGTGLPGFRRTCRSADLLAIDDLQFFVGKKATIVELQQTIDVLQRQGRQLVFACDREPDSLTDLGQDLLVRLRGGMTARLLPPDADVRRGIVVSIAARRGLALPADVVEFVASRMTRHSRELAGAVNRLEATSHMLGLPITLAMAEEALADLVRASARSVRLADIERAVCAAFGIASGTLQSAQRGKKVNHPRMLAMFLARKHTPAPLTEIGSYFGRRSHSTVISAQKAVDEWVAKQSQIVLADATWDVAEAIRRVEETLRAG